jgi:hypothetical protein
MKSKVLASHLLVCHRSGFSASTMTLATGVIRDAVPVLRWPIGCLEGYWCQMDRLESPAPLAHDAQTIDSLQSGPVIRPEHCIGLLWIVSRSASRLRAADYVELFAV